MTNDGVKGEPLPTDFTHPSPTILEAHKICRNVETDLLSTLSNAMAGGEHAIVKRKLINIRILGHFLTFAPSDSGKAHVASGIVACSSQEELFALGLFYDKHFIRTFRKAKGSTPVTSRHSSRSSINQLEDAVEKELTSTPTDHQGAKTNALVRDNYRCVISGVFDLPSVYEIDEPGLREQADQDGRAVDTECTYIFSESTTTNLDSSGESRYAGNAWAIIEAFGYAGIREDLSGAKIHSLQNVLTLVGSLRSMFDKMLLWLEPTATANCYRVRTTQPLGLKLWQVPKFVTFTSTNPRLELPSATFLAIHAACCRVAHMSGAAEYFDKMLDPGNDLSGYTPQDPEQFAGMLAARLYDISCS